MSEVEIIQDAELIGEELVPAGHGNLFRTEDPVEIIRRATETASALSEVLRKQKLTTNIQGREHVRVEGWTLLGTMLGVFPVCEWTRPLEGQSGWEARVVARTLAGQEVGAAEAQCSRSENTWKNRDDYALRSMAQTRATSKALRQPLGFVVTLAGFEATPAEEMDFTSAPVDKQARVEGPNPVKVPTSWAKITELVSAYDQFVHDTFGAYVDAASRFLFEGKLPKELKVKADKDVLFQVAAGAAVRLREGWEPSELPYPDVDEIGEFFLGGPITEPLALPAVALDEQAAEAAERDQ